MAELYFPFNSVNGDRRYKAEDWAQYFALILGNGIFYSDSNQLKVVIDENMNITVKSGSAFINGRCYCNSADKSIELDDADGVLDRIDRIVVKCDYSNRNVAIAIKKGQYSAQPTATDLQRDADVFEITLADISIVHGTIAITQSMITDQRLNNDVCGIVTGLVEQADTSDIFDQFQAYLNEFKIDIGEWFDETSADLEEDFETWFDSITAMLEDNVAATLAQRILVLEGQVSTIEDEKTDIISRYETNGIAFGEEATEDNVASFVQQIRAKGGIITDDDKEYIYDMAKNLGATSGYQKLSSGLIIQFGIATTAANASTVQVTFPMRFPTALVGFSAISKPVLSSTQCVTANMTAIGGTLSVVTSAGIIPSYAIPINWIAIGY